MPNVGTAYVDVVPVLDKFGAALTKGIGPKVAAVGKKISSAGSTLTKGITLPVVALGAVALNAASDLAESMSKVDVVFGKNADVIKRWSADASTSLGMSQQQALEAAGTYGNLFRAMEIGQGPAQKMSTGLVDLSADLASFNNMDPTQVLDALRSGLSGETEPLKKLGVNLTQARIEAEAATLGLSKHGKELTASAKAQATYSLIMKDTTLAQGDFARTADGVANQQRIVKAEFQDAAATIGAKLLPIGQKLLKWASGLLDKFTALSPGTQDLILKVAGVGAALGPVLVVTGKFTSGLGSLIGGIAKVIGLFVVKTTAASADAVATSAAATATWAFNAALLATVLAIALIVIAVVAVAIVIYKNWDAIKAFLLKVWKSIKAAGLAVWKAIKSAAITIWKALKAPVVAYFNFYRGVFRTIVAVAKAAWNGIKSAALTIWRWLTSTFRTVKNAFLDGWRAIGDVGSGIWDAIKSAAVTVFNAIANVWNSTVGSLRFEVPSFIPVLGGKGWDVPDIPTFGRGGMLTTGPAIVGEAGTELIAGRAVVPMTGAKGRRIMEGLIGSAGARSIEGTLTLTPDGRAFIRGVVVEEQDADARFQSRIARMGRSS